MASETCSVLSWALFPRDKTLFFSDILPVLSRLYHAEAAGVHLHCCAVAARFPMCYHHFQQKIHHGVTGMATELEIMMHAKTYLDKLAGGINPLSDEPLPETDVVRQERISRCLSYVSDILRQVIEKGGLKKPSSRGTVPFHLTPEQAAHYLFPEMPVSLSVITTQLNALAENPDMKKLTYRSIAALLEQEGYIVQVTDPNGKSRRLPTEKGKALGISTVDRLGSRGYYTVVLYNSNAQQYILDHMEAIAQIAREQQTETVSPAADRPEESIRTDS